MSRSTPQMREFAERLIAQETKGNKSSGRGAESVSPVLERLRPHMATLMGSTGFRALVMRALTLSNPEVAWLRRVQVAADGSLEHSDGIEAQVHPDEIARGRVVLVAHLLGLMVAFIGEDLTVRLAREVWPKLSLDDPVADTRRQR